MPTSAPFRPERMKGIIEDLYVTRRVPLIDVQDTLAEVYGVALTKNQLEKRITDLGFRKKRDKKRVKQFDRLEPLSDGLPVTTTLLKNIVPPDVHRRRELILYFVQNTIDLDFQKFQNKEQPKRRFDLIWLTHGKEYHRSWAKLYEESAKLPKFARNDKLEEFNACVDKILADIYPAMRGENEVTIMVGIWRVAYDLLSDSVKRLRENLLEKFFQRLCDERREFLRTQELDPLVLLCTHVLNSPPEELIELLRLGYERSITRLQYHYIDHNFTIPQMTTNYLMYWDRDSTRFPNLIADFEDLILHTGRRYGSKDWRTITCLQQFLDYTFRIKGDRQRSAQIAEILHSRTQEIMSTSKRIIWDAVTAGFVLASKALISWHGDRLEAETAMRYFNDLWDVLVQGDEECQRRAQSLVSQTPEVRWLEEMMEDSLK